MTRCSRKSLRIVKRAPAGFFSRRQEETRACDLAFPRVPFALLTTTVIGGSAGESSGHSADSGARLDAGVWRSCGADGWVGKHSPPRGAPDRADGRRNAHAGAHDGCNALSSECPAMRLEAPPPDSRCAERLYRTGDAGAHRSGGIDGASSATAASSGAPLSPMTPFFRSTTRAIWSPGGMDWSSLLVNGSRDAPMSSGQCSQR